MRPNRESRGIGGRASTNVTPVIVPQNSSVIWIDKIVLLTGASSGIGEALALELSTKGATLGLLARREELLADIAAKCEAAGGTARVFPCDVMDSDAVHDAATNLREEFGHIDILIANAGIGGNNKAAQSYEPTAVEKIIDVNFLGAVHAVHAVLPYMLERGLGHLVGISSLAGIRGLPKFAAYSASKAALTAFLESVRLDVQNKGVAVTIIQPGFIRTPLNVGRTNMPFVMELADAIPYFIRAIEKKKRFAAFPLPAATIVRIGKLMPSWLYDRVAGDTRE